MLENQLRKFPFFRKLGAFGMNQNSPTDIRRMLSYMSELLHPDHMIVYFPQGKIVPDVPAPFILSKGLTYLQTKYPVQILPLRMHWESLNTRKPAVFISWGTPIPLEQYKAHTELLNEQFEALRNKETAALTTGNFGTCIYGKKHVGF